MWSIASLAPSMAFVDEDAATLAANLRRYRQRAGLSQEQLAHAANLHPNAIGLIERGLRDPRLSTLRALVEALSTASGQRVTIGDLIAVAPGEDLRV